MDREIIHSRLMQLVDNNKRNELRGALLMLNVVDIAEFMEELESEKLLMVFRILPKDIAADVFAYMSPEQQQQLIQLIGDGEIHSLMEEMFLDDTVDFLEELPASVVKRVLQNTDSEKRALINQFLRYGTSVGANVREAQYAHGTADFIAKLQIALKECSETEYWIELLLESGYYSNRNILEKCVEVKKILISSVNTAKAKNE